MISTHVVMKSSNKKTGPMATTYRTQKSCPTTCPLMGQGCYATGRIFGISERLGRTDVDAVRALVDTLPIGHGLRLNVSGDFLDESGALDTEYVDACNAVADARPDVKIIAYTHAWRTLDASAFHFPVNASCETDDDVLDALAAGWQAVTVDGAIGSTLADRRVVQCPAEVRDDVTCASCGVCAASTRTRPVVSFTAHGAGKKRASAAVAASRI